jgi:hypothetical protein
MSRTHYSTLLYSFDTLVVVLRINGKLFEGEFHGLLLLASLLLLAAAGKNGNVLTGTLCESQGLCGGSKMWYGSLHDRCGRVLLRNWRFGLAMRYADLSAQRPF